MSSGRALSLSLFAPHEFPADVHRKQKVERTKIGGGDQDGGVKGGGEGKIRGNTTKGNLGLRWKKTNLPIKDEEQERKSEDG